MHIRFIYLDVTSSKPSDGLTELIKQQPNAGQHQISSRGFQTGGKNEQPRAYALGTGAQTMFTEIIPAGRCSLPPGPIFRNNKITRQRKNGTNNFKHQHNLKHEECQNLEIETCPNSFVCQNDAIPHHCHTNCGYPNTQK